MDRRARNALAAATERLSGLVSHKLSGMPRFLPPDYTFHRHADADRERVREKLAILVFSSPVPRGRGPRLRRPVRSPAE